MQSAPDKYHFETGVYRPPSEGGSHSLLVRFTRNCPWNHCTFCGMYKTEKFEIRPVAEIKRDIDAMGAISAELRAISLELGFAGRLTQDVVLTFFGRVPALDHHPGFAMLYYWLLSGARTAFIQDANSLIMKTDHLVDALNHLRRTFATITRVTSYARAKTVAQKSAQELIAIRRAGLDRLHLGLETGDEVLLSKIRKGVTPEGLIEAGRKAVAAGFQVSEYWMPGLGGRALWENHARNTARVLTAINPHYIRSRPFHPWEGTPLTEALARGEMQMLSPREQLLELQLMISELSVDSRVCFDHAGNYWKNRHGGLLFSQDYEGYQFPEQKPHVLDLIAEGLTVEHSQAHRLHF